MRILVAMAGAPTAVVNRSVRGVVTAAPGEVLCAAGPDGLVDPTSWRSLTVDRVPESLAGRPGSLIGGGRRSVSADDLDRIVRALDEAGITRLVLIGGNGTMALADNVAACAEQRDQRLTVIGVPKTIDNDLFGVQVAPGYPSAARAVCRVVADLGRDHATMAAIEPVRLVETMGRSVGWLALAATRQSAVEECPHLVLLPENVFSVEEFLSQVSQVVRDHGRALVVLSEGVAPEVNEDPVMERNHTVLIQGGVGRRLAELIRRELGLPTRAEVLGTVQRSASWAVTAADARAATQVGELAARWISDSAHHRMMVGGEPGGWRPVPLNEVANRVRPVPARWARPGADLTDFHHWLEPLLEPSHHH